MHERFNGTMENWHIEEFIICACHLILPINYCNLAIVCVTHDGYKRSEQFKLENLVKRNSLRDIGIDGRLLLYIILRGSREGYLLLLTHKI
jgi:hypothetical protein